MARTIFIGRVSLNKCFFQTLAIKPGLRCLNFHSGFYRKNEIFPKFNPDPIFARSTARAFSWRLSYGLIRRDRGVPVYLWWIPGVPGFRWWACLPCVPWWGGMTYPQASTWTGGWRGATTCSASLALQGWWFERAGHCQGALLVGRCWDFTLLRDRISKF